MTLPPLKSLQFFLIAAQLESFKLAAERLFVTQAAVSQQIRQLEQHLGCQLFNRHGGKTKLTPNGYQLLPFIEQAFQQFELGVSSLKRMSSSNELKISALHSLTSLVLIPKIDSFNQKHPDIHVQFSPNNKLDDFESVDIDIAIRRGKGNYPGLESRKLINDQIVLVASPAIGLEKLSHLDDVKSFPILEDTSSDIQEAINDFSRKFKIKRDKLTYSLRTTDSLPIVQNALAGKGLAFVSKSLVNDLLKEGTLVNVLNYSFETDRTLYLVAPQNRFSLEKVKHVEDWLREILSF